MLKLHQNNRLDLSVIHGDGATTAAQKGGVREHLAASDVVRQSGAFALFTNELAQLSLFAVPERATSLIFKDFDLKGLHYGRRLA